MLCCVLGRQEEQAAHPQIGTSREIQEGVRSGAANIQQLAISESDFRIACRKRARVRCDGSRCSALIQFRMAWTFCSAGWPSGTIASENPSRYRRTEYSR